MDTLRIIAGSGRSGTTWVLDAIAEANGLRPIFEPLHPDSSKIAQDFGYAHLTRDAEHADMRRFIAALADRESRTVWTSYRINPVRLRLTREQFRSATEWKRLVKKWLLLARRQLAYRARERHEAVIVKCIRANLMLDWIQTNFDAKIVLLMRHPCAVVESQLRFAEHWDPYRLLEKYRNDKALMNGPLRERADVLNQKLSRPQALTAIWCIENLVPALQAGANHYQMVFYEELLEHPVVEWQRVVDGLGLSVVPDAGLLQQPSQQSAVRLQQQETQDGGYSRSYASWRQRLGASDLREIAALLRDFGVSFYTVSDDRPNVESFTHEFLSA